MLSARPAGLPLDTDRGISTKTPGRVLNKTRNVLQENAVRNVPMTVVGKGKKLVQNTPLQLTTLQTDHVLKDAPGKQIGPSKLKDTPAVRPLGDKTPFPNRTAPQLPATGTKIAKPSLVDGSLRPSSARKHDRLPRSAGKTFETPITDGKHWDVSDIDIEVDAPVASQSIEEESFDEIEYMAPKVEDVPYEPPFEMPNYREVGKTLMALIRSYSLEDDPSNNDLTFTADASEKHFFAPPVVPQQELEDDSPFARTKPELELESKQSSATIKQRSSVTSKPAVRLAVRAIPATRTITPANSRVSPPIKRPLAASSARSSATTTRTSSSQPVTRAPTSQSTLRAPASRATTRVPSVARSTPPVRTGSVQLSRATSLSRPAAKPAARSTAPTAPVKGKTATTQPSTTIQATRNPVPRSTNMAPPNSTRPRSGTITKEEFESNTHVAVHIRNNSLEDVKKDLEGLIVFEDEFDEFRFEV
ncbi:hypothetical protein JVU11DRAFT_2918 [Chiua virens]|nr:hypothetical protein JVU11DRAFT_2918 [Chiua virens]